MSDALAFAALYFVALLTLGAIGLHIAVIMFLIAAAGALTFFGPRMLVPMGNLAWSTLNEYVLVSVPLFVLLGEILLRGGVTDRMYRSLSVWISGFPGGLIHSNIASSALFAATSGSSIATAATIGTVAIPALKARGYDDRIVLGSLAAGGTLGILIPPSINMIIYGAMTDTSIGRLFVAGVIPGLVLTALFMAVIAVLATLRPDIAPREKRRPSIREKLSLLPGLVPPLVVFVVVMGSIYGGLATPTEAAGLGVVAALVLAAMNGRLSIAMLHHACASTIRTTALVLLIILAAFCLNFVVSLLGIPQAISQWVKGLGLSGLETIWILLVIYLVLGCFLESLSMMITTIPIVAPVVFALGIDPVWFGVFIVLVTELALITPPVGMNLYVVQGIRTDGGRIDDVIRGAVPFVLVLLLFTIFIMYVPRVVLWLPNALFGT